LLGLTGGAGVPGSDVAGEEVDVDWWFGVGVAGGGRVFVAGSEAERWSILLVLVTLGTSGCDINGDGEVSKFPKKESDSIKFPSKELSVAALFIGSSVTLSDMDKSLKRSD